MNASESVSSTAATSSKVSVSKISSSTSAKSKRRPTSAAAAAEARKTVPETELEDDPNNPIPDTVAFPDDKLVSSKRQANGLK